jgi:hypothetical protein
MEAIFTVIEGGEFPLFTVNYVEPTKNTDGSDIDNLAFTTTWYEIDGRQTPAIQLEATDPKGGHDVSWSGFVSVNVGENKLVKFWATATNKNGKESDKSSVVEIQVDRRNLVPMPPQ